jgi:hypothetical protein
MRYETSKDRAFHALLVGAFVASTATTVVMLFLLFVTAAPWLLIFGFFKFWPSLTIAYWIGLMIVMTPCWLVLHRAGWRQWWCLSIAGAVGLFAITFSAGPFFSDEGFEVGFPAMMSIVGGMTGLAIWRAAYRRIENPAE